MRRKSLLNFFPAALCAVALASLALSASAQGIVPAPSADANRIVSQFIARETEFQRAFLRYAFRRDAVIQSLGMGGQVAGEFHRVSRISFDEQGKQLEKVLTMPIPSLAPSQTDIDDLNTIQLFVLEAPKLAQYDFKLVGTEKVDELGTYVFDVQPKAMPNPKKSKDRFFQGRIWIDDQDFMLVKARGKGVPEGKEAFPVFDYYREHDGRYWVPSLVSANDQLVMPSGEVVRVRIRVKYTDYEAPPAK
ncbi:MAG: hypothetical protein QOF61_2418 [Acidobacteriota bacterium]|nr:hypothetical protein [Acidobacteriota bacterium]